MIVAASARDPAMSGWLAARGTPGLVSVVIPTYNRAALVQETLCSIAAQSWRSIEIIVVDDGSTDDTYAALRRWQSAHPSTSLRIIRQANRGPASARNRGAGQARGEFVYFIDSDDLVLSDAIAALAARLIAAGAPYSVAHIDNTNLAGDPVSGDSEGVSRIVEGNYFASRWMTHAALYRRETLAAAGPFDETLGRGEDTEHLWRVMATSGPGPILPRVIGVRRLHDFGHLCVGRSTGDAAHDDLATITRFADWAAARQRIDPCLAQSIVRRGTIAAIRSGAAGRWACNAEALALLSRMAPHRPRLARIACRLLRLRTRAIYVPLGLTIELLKWLRDKRRAPGAGATRRRWPRLALGLAEPARSIAWPAPNGEPTAMLGA
jgi:hypothetical protein